MTTKEYEAKIIPATGGSPIDVTVPASDHVQAKKLIEKLYGPVKTWYKSPQPKKTK